MPSEVGKLSISSLDLGAKTETCTIVPEPDTSSIERVKTAGEILINCLAIKHG